MIMTKIKHSIISTLAGLVLLAAACAPRPDFDTIITNGFVFDGAGNPWVYTDIGIKDDKIAAMGNLKDASAERTIDASGYYVTPGFIDSHSHAERGLTSSDLSHARPQLAQGITSIVVNQCGGGAIDLEKQREELLEDGTGVNVAQLVPHGNVRKEVMGEDDREAEPEEMEEMKSMIREAMEYGAFGMSTGLFYIPGYFTPTSELIELSEVVAKYGGVHQSHIRDEADGTVGFINSVEEIIEISKESGVTGIITHIKAGSPPTWGDSEEIVARIAEVRDEGVEIFTDQYPYEALSTGIIAQLVPTWAREGGNEKLRERLEDPELLEPITAETRENLEREGGPDKVQFRRFSQDTTIEGKRLDEVARERNMDPTDLIIDLIQEGSPSIVLFSIGEDDIERFMTQKWNMTGSDGGLVEMDEGVPHPRNYGTFPRKIRKYVFEENLLELEDAIRSMTSLTSSVFGINDRGTLRTGMKADIVIFDPEKITDKATYAEPHQLSEGMVYVFVNGTPAIEEGEFTGELPGRVLQRGK